MHLSPRCVFLLPVVVLACGLLAGCGKEEEIRQYTVAREAPPDLSAFAAPAPATGPKARTLGAMVPAGERTWYFKMQGPDEPVSAQMAAFLALIQSVKLTANSEPEWTLPEGWTQEGKSTGSSGIARFATLKTGGENPLEVTVIPLDGELSNEDYLLANINRWRNELGLKRVTGKDLFRESRKDEIRKVDFQVKDIVLVNMAGVLQPKGMGAPFAGGRTPVGSSEAGSQNGAAPKAVSPKTVSPKTDGPITWTTPEGWKPGKMSAMRKAAFAVSEGDKAVEITVIDLPAQGSGSEVLDNVNRWRGQVGLDKIDKAQLEKTSKAIDVGGTEGRFVELVGAKKTSGTSDTILAVMAIRDGSAWFFKLQGDSTLAAREKTKFEEFVKSVKFR